MLLKRWVGHYSLSMMSIPLRSERQPYIQKIYSKEQGCFSNTQKLTTELKVAVVQYPFEFQSTGRARKKEKCRFPRKYEHRMNLKTSYGREQERRGK